MILYEKIRSTKRISVIKGIFCIIFLFAVSASAAAQNAPAPASLESNADPRAENDRMYYENGQGLLKMKQTSKALLCFSEYLELFPEGAFRKDALLNIGDIYLARFDYKNALRYYQNLYQEFSPEEEGINGYFQMGICYSRMGNTGKAAEVFNEIIELYPASRYAQKAKTQLDIEEIIKK